MPELTVGSADFEALAAEILGTGNALRFRARGISMEPFINDGDVVEVGPVGTAQVRTGDVILASIGHERMVVHRVVGFREDCCGRTLVLQGDALPRPDGCVRPDQVMGRATGVARGVRTKSLDRGVVRWLGLLWIRTRPAASRAFRVGRAARWWRPTSHPASSPESLSAGDT